MNLLALLVGPKGPAVAAGGDRAGPIERSGTQGAVEQLPLLVRDALAAAKLGFSELDAFAVLTGPGRFTAIRAAVAAARALSLATGRGIYALSAFELGAAARAGPALVVVPVGREELALQPFDGPDAPCAEPALVSRCDLARAVEGAHRLVLVDPDPELAARAPEDAVFVESTAGFLWTAARARARRGIGPAPGPSVRPLYLRPPDARLEAGRPLVLRS
ncbi:MAG: tRNA (adenosine(37)-N6)-threonylcarbamoyltransferase complex dimerization subunit type 1 TsaB [Geminicoccaceae bacterium]|nr:tRNA (adenosine(37)-N6)-threonylcarbamoyltransferase complex dimerization subunit type 1 TsaB [Geminicoccaceae bacterium]